MAERVFTFNPYQMTKASQLENVAQRIFNVRAEGGDIGAHPLHQHFENADGKIEFMVVTPQMLWGMMRCRRSLYDDLASPDTAQAIVEKYLTLNDQI